MLFTVISDENFGVAGGSQIYDLFGCFIIYRTAFKILNILKISKFQEDC